MFTELKGLVDVVSAITQGKNTFQLKKHIRSISSYSGNNIFYFPLIVSSQCAPDEVEMMSKATERQAASFVSACMSLIPFHKVSQNDRGSIEEYLSIFHQNIGIDSPVNMNDVLGKVFNESAIGIDEDKCSKEFFASLWKKTRFNLNEYLTEVESEVGSLNELFTSDNLSSHGKFLKRQVDKKMKELNEDTDTEYQFKLQTDIDVTPSNDIKAGALRNQHRQAVSSFGGRDKIFTDMDVKKANDLHPLFFKVTVGFIIEETGETISQEVLVGVKAFVHRLESSKMVNNIVSGVKNRQKFLKMVKWVTGEKESLADILFGFKQIKLDATKTKDINNNLIYMIKRRVNWSRKGIKYITRNWNPNVTNIMTMDEVMFIKNEMGLDVMKSNHIKDIMKDNYLLMFVILDQLNKSAHIMYDGHRYQFQEISYTALERETTERDRATRELFKTFARN